jgi:sigma-B regulation protein RsbU (phosphoserine phosphatase)
MRAVDDIRNAWKWLGLAGQVLVIALIAGWVLSYVGKEPFLRLALSVTATIAGVVLAFRVIRGLIRQSIWRLRNRLIVAYLFVALVPILLIGTLAMIAVWTLSGQIALYLITSEFNRRLSDLQANAVTILSTPEERRPLELRQTGEALQRRFPNTEVLVISSTQQRFPESGLLPLANARPNGYRGVAAIGGECFALVVTGDRKSRVAVAVPLTRDFLSDLVAGIGEISILSIPQGASRKTIKAARSAGKNGAVRGSQLPEKKNALDLEVLWASRVSVADLDAPNASLGGLFSVRSRLSAVWLILLQQVDQDNSVAMSVIIVFAVAFLLVEIAAFVVGVSLSRSITSSVHNLYEGTERVMEGEFSHRILVQGRDQLAALGHSFNRMTENLERLLQVAKEKERYEAELEIAREIQKQLYPKSVPESAQLKLVALYKPARMVSGDYYDYRRLDDSKIAIAIGDVAGKGISAALLMATVQSGFRSQLQLASSSGGHSVGTSLIVSRLNEQLHANTPPEKFATFFVGVFDETTSTLHYTNAGHLQPILIRDSQAKRLEVDGMVIGAFPFARYGESQIELLPGDLLVCFTDGISEPENEYGEMFGEDQLVELVLKNASRSEEQIVQTIIEAVEKWTGSPELQDDMTLLVARRKSS